MSQLCIGYVSLKIYSNGQWESGDAEQAAFVTRFFDLTGSLDREMAIWSFMYDLSVQKPFDSMGLIKKDGTARPSWEVWIKRS